MLFSALVIISCWMYWEARMQQMREAVAIGALIFGLVIA